MKSLANIICAASSAALLFCASSQAGAQQQGQQPSSDQPCNTVATAIGGALLGALLGGKGHRAGGAAIGGTLGGAACMAINFRAKQIKTAQQVNDDYLRNNGGAMPTQATVVRFDTKFEPTARIQAGGSSNLNSYIEVADGSDGLRPTIEEEITLISPDGKPLKTIRKPAAQAPGGGGFLTQFSLSLPQGVSQGVYPIQAALYMNNQKVSESSTNLQVVLSETGFRVAMAR
jgi:hypothetical protein